MRCVRCVLSTFFCCCCWLLRWHGSTLSKVVVSEVKKKKTPLPGLETCQMLLKHFSSSLGVPCLRAFAALLFLPHLWFVTMVAFHHTAIMVLVNVVNTSLISKSFKRVPRKSYVPRAQSPSGCWCVKSTGC